MSLIYDLFLTLLFERFLFCFLNVVFLELTVASCETAKEPLRTFELGKTDV